MNPLNLNYTQQMQQPQSPAFMGAQPLGFNMDTLRLGLGGIQTIGNLWNAFEANKLAKEQFDFTKGITNTNLANIILV
jgi:hypothetical protein